MHLSDDELERLARKRAGAKLGWYLHAAIYVVVNIGLFALSNQGVGHRPWSIYPLLGWGLGVVLHGISVFVLGSGVRERMVERERQRLLRERDRGREHGRPDR